MQSQAALEPSAKRKQETFPTAEAEKRRCRVDFDILECPICLETHAPPVYQCENGHTACASCCNSFVNGCPSCTSPVGPPITIRNRAVEKMIESVEISCKYAQSGCMSMLKLSEREEHENQLCNHRPIQCPILGHHELEVPISMAAHLSAQHGAMIVEFSELQGQQVSR